MSQSEWTFRLTDANGRDVIFANWNADSQLMPSSTKVIEELETEGVDGILMRERGARPDPLRFRITYPHTQGGDIGELDRILGSNKGNIVRITLRDRPGSTQVVTQWSKRECFFEQFQILDRGARLNGFGAVTGSTRTTVAMLMLRVVGNFG